MLLEFFGQVEWFIHAWRGSKVGWDCNFDLLSIFLFLIINVFLTAELKVFIDDKVTTELAELVIIVVSKMFDVYLDRTGAIQQGLKVFTLL